MDKFPDTSADPRSDLARLLPQDALQQILLILRSCLPPPRTDDQQALARRERAALAGVASLLPRNAVEGRLAAQFVAADAWAMDCLYLAGERQEEMEAAHQSRAQAIGMMREAKLALRTLLKLQAARRMVVADKAGAKRTAEMTRSVSGLMREGLDADPGVPADPSGTQTPALQKPVPQQSAAGGDAAAAGKFRLVSNTGTKSHSKSAETSPRLTLVPAKPRADPAGSWTDGTKPPGPGNGWKGREH